MFNHPEAKSGLRKDRADSLLSELINALEGACAQSSRSDGSAGGALVGSNNVTNVPVPLPGENQGSI